MSRTRPHRRARSSLPPRVGLFGLLGGGNIGNDASMEVILRYLRSKHPEAIVDAMGTGPERLASDFGLQAIPYCWHQQKGRPETGAKGFMLKVLGKGLDAFRVPAWVRRHDVVIVPGMGVLEATLPLRPWETPYMMLLLCASGRLFGTKVALVSVGANAMRQRVTRLLFNSAAGLAFYRSYRDTVSFDAMRQRGFDTNGDRVYPDLVFGTPAPPLHAVERRTVGVGLMGYYGTNDDRQNSEEIHTSYVDKMKSFVRWLVDQGRDVRLLVGDKFDHEVMREILADVQAYRTDLDPSRVVAAPVTSFGELTTAMAPAYSVVATRYHNVLCALKLAKPTISLGYAAKNVALMEDAGLGRYCQSANSLDVELLIEQFTELESHSDELVRTIADRNEANARLIERQFDELSALLFPELSPI